MLNPELKPGDRVILLYMKDETVPPGTVGTVTRKSTVFGTDHYNVKWDNGSSLALLSDVDAWTLEKKKKIEEQTDPLINNNDLFRHFKTNFLFDYLKKLRESSVVNMYGASPYLYMGEERMRGLHYDEDREEFSEVLELSDKAQHVMVQGVMKVLENEGKDVDVSNINRYLKKYSQKMLDLYIYRMSL